MQVHVPYEKQQSIKEMNHYITTYHHHRQQGRHNHHRHQHGRDGVAVKPSYLLRLHSAISLCLLVPHRFSDPAQLLDPC